MTNPMQHPRAAGTPAARTATRLAFLIAGLAISAWAPLVPYAKTRLGVSDGALGLLLLCLGAGSIVAMPVAGALAGRVGCRRVIIAATALTSLTLPLLATLSSTPLMGGALFLFGAGVGSIDCAINIQAVIVQRESGRALMSGFHGLFSVGGILGAGAVSLLLGWGVTPLGTTLLAAAAALALLLLALPGLLQTPTSEPGAFLAMPRGPVLLLGLLCLVMFLTEGAILDWSALFLSTERGVAPAHAGLGYAVFATVMTIGRLTGDRVVHALGGRRVVAFGAALAAAGLALAVLTPAWQAAIAGYALVGAGCSNIVPVLYSAAGRQRAMPENAAITALTTLGYAGILAGPALVGFVAHATSLSVAFLVLAAALLAVALASRLISS